MVQFQSGVMEKTRFVSNVLLVVLLAGNLYFSVQYIHNLKDSQAPVVDKGAQEVLQIKNANFLKLFINKVVKSSGTVTYEDRVQLENDVRQIHNPELTAQWELFVDNKDPKKAEQAATDLMLILAEGAVK
jgi:predicted DNA-binding helix-hairpin-helix protein